MTVEAVIDSQRGLVVAPAGCGKTHLITETLKVQTAKPCLVLTHTTAGLAALKQRLKRQNVPKEHYRVSTIDGWALGIANMFSASCTIQSTPDNPRAFYPELHHVVNAFLSAGHIEDIIRASYSRLLVDEYQDCNIAQHTLVCAVSEILPTVVFGDPMQTIFDFGGLVHPCWTQVVQTHFPQIVMLDTPWRWNNAGTPELGQWILDARNSLIQGDKIYLQSLRRYVKWVQLTGNDRTDSQNQNNIQYQIRNRNPTNESLLVIGDSTNKGSRHNFAKTARGIEVVEPVDLGDVTDAASIFDANQGAQLVEQVLAAAATMMTGVERTLLLKRLQTILSGRNRTPATPVELAAKAIVEQGGKKAIQELLHQLEKKPTSWVYRRGAFSALKATVAMSISDPIKSMQEAAAIIREQRRHDGDRRIPRLAIGSTLLLKGLEADHVLILNAGNMNAKHLYVALSRGAKSITTFSQNDAVGYR